MIGRTRKTKSAKKHRQETTKSRLQTQFSDAPLIIDRGESLQKPESAFHFVVDLLAKIGIPPSLPRADCSLWKHGAEHCRTAVLARGSARGHIPQHAGRAGGAAWGGDPW